MPNLIVLLTYKYPFEPPCEQFLDEEIANHTGRVCLIPCSWSISKGNVHKRFKEKQLDTLLFNRRKRIGFIFGLLIAFFKSLKFCRKDKKIDKGIRTKTSLSNYTKSIFIANRVLKGILKKYNLNDFDKIIVYSYWLNANSTIAYFLKKLLLKKHKKVVSIARAHGQGDLFLSEERKHINRPGVFAVQSLDRIFAISEIGKNHLVEEGFANVELSRLGTFNGSYTSPVKKESFHLVSCSTVNDNKNVLEIAKQVSLSQFPVVWTHFGDGPLFEELKSLCDDCSNKNVTFDIKGNTTNQEIKDYYKNNHPDLFINVSKIEGIPVSIMEAMSYGIPCIATDVGATSEIVIDGFNGFLIPLNQINDLHKVVDHFYSMNDKQKCLLGKNAYDYWEHNFNAEKNYREFAKKISKL